jgi:threonyl-tRNA synthetase
MDKQHLNNLRHSAAHLLAAAALELWPDTKLTIGPAIENGFYYDFEFARPLTEEDLPKIEKKMAEILPSWHGFSHREVSYEDAKKYYENNPYKLELIEEIHEKGEPITFYKAGEFEDLCRGGHSENPAKDVGAVKLLNIAGAYWRGSEKNKMLTRIYATAFPSQKELDEYLVMLEEAKKRDHKKIGRDLELFIFEDTAPGEVYWLPKGLRIYNTLYNYARQLYKKYGYLEVATPLLNKQALYETSGHWTHYKDDMFVADMGKNEVFGLKPMNCPNAMTIFGYKTRSHNELPLRLAETSMLHRFELSGTLNGLFRIRAFRQDDAHIFISDDQIKSEFAELLKMVEEMYAPFDLTYKLRFGTRPEKFMGEKKDWDHAEKELQEALDASGLEYFTAEGEGAFYGPKVDILMKDLLGREWQTGTIQLDYQQPKNFKLLYAASDGTLQQPVVIHRAIYGSFERFLGILTEHYAGAFPLWLAPVQIELLPIADRHVEYAKSVMKEFTAAGFRVFLNSHSGTLQSKIREATLQKVPYLGIIGDREVDNHQVSVRIRSGEDLGALDIPQFVQKVQKEIDKKA